MLREALTDLISLVLSLMSTISSDRKNSSYGRNTCGAQSVPPKAFVTRKIFIYQDFRPRL